MRSPATMFLPQPADSAVERAARLGLTPEVLGRVRARLRGLLLVMFVVVSASLVVTLAVARADGTPLEVLRDVLAGTVVTVLVTGAGYFAMRSAWVRDDLAVWVGFGMELFLAASASMGNYVGYYPTFGHLPLITWTVGIMLVFPLVVPRPASLTLVMAILSAACIPGTAVFLDATGEIHTTADELTALTINAAFAAGIAFFAARIAYGLTIDADKARQLGSYHLETKLGAGGMGEVWRATHGMLSRPAAVKLISQDMLGSDVLRAEAALRRFNQEAEATASLRSQHTVDIYDFGRTQDGKLFYVMELLDGIDMQELVERFGPLPANRVVHLVEQVCRSLHEAHLVGLVHRDIKPANLFVCRYGAEIDFVKVLDFGLVKQVAQPVEGDPNLTAGGIVVGTPACMPPEMALGAADIDGRADLYALGCVAYWLLTGRFPFTAESSMQTMVKHINEPPDPPAHHSELPIPAALNDLVLACLQKKPEDRPVDARAIIARLDTIAVEPWTEADAHKWWHTHRPA